MPNEDENNIRTRELFWRSRPWEGLDRDSEEVIRRFHLLYEQRSTAIGGNPRWLGVPALKSPLDLWVYQEIVFMTQPDVIVEAGTARGGSAYFLASVCELLGRGRVVTIDPRLVEGRPHHERITYLTASSVTHETVAAVRGSIRPQERVMIILDSAHHTEHVLEEMRLYSPMVTQDNYLVVEDTSINGHPVLPEFGPGPMEAVDAFVTETDEFMIDRSCERFLMTFHPRGFLRRVSG